MSEFLEFRETAPEPGKKTKLWDVLAKRDQGFLGRIGYYPQWRKYIFAPGAQTLFDAKCLADIQMFLIEHRDDRV